MKLNIPPGTWPPGGWQYFDPKTNYRENKPTEHDRREAAQSILNMRRNNRHIYKGLDLTYEASLQALEDYTVKRMVNMGQWQLIIKDGEIAPANPKAVVLKKKLFPPRLDAKPAEEKKPSWLERARKLANGVRTLTDWVGHGQQPVPQAVADRRASICVTCSLNDTKSNNPLTNSVSEAIHKQMELKEHINLRTSMDDKLGTCKACLCPLKLKVWTPIKFIEEHTDREMILELATNCWITAELV